MLNSWSQLLTKSAWKQSVRLTKTYFICASKLIALLLFRAGQISSNFVPGYTTMTSVICSHSRSDFSMFQLTSICILFSRISAILFQPITARLFPIAIPFPAIFILTILLDKQLIKSFENDNILFKENFFIEKSFYLKKNFLGRKMFFWRKKCF